MKVRPRYLVGIVILAIVVIVIVVNSLSNSSTGKNKNTSSLDKPLDIVAGPAGIVSGTSPDSSNHSWVLVNLGKKANLQYINLSTGAISGAVPVTNQARVVTVAPGGEIGVGLGEGTNGAVEFFSPQGFNLEGVVALSGPVRDLVAGSDGKAYYALQDVNGADSVSVISSKMLKSMGTIPLPSQTLSIAVSPDLTSIYSLQANGNISVSNVQTGVQTQSIPLAAGARQIVLSTDGATLYALKGSTEDDNVAEIDVTTEATKRVLPAPKNTLWIAPSSDGSQLFDFVGTAKTGNIQSFSTHR
jgi:hypothetical protein